MYDMMTRCGKYNAESPETILLLLCPVHLTFDHLTPDLIKNIFVSRVIYMHDMVTLRGKDNALEPGNHIATLLSSVFDL